MEPIDISVILVLRNRAESVPTALAHLEQQTLPAAHYEIVAVDNGSTDGTLAVLERYAAGAPVCIYVLDTGRCNVARARNLGVERARGKWIVFLDQDVLASPNLLERYARAFQAESAHPFLMGQVAMHPQLPANSLTRLFFQEDLPAPKDPNRLAPADWHGFNFGASRSLLRDNGGFDESFPGTEFLEAELAHRFASCGVSGRLVPKAFVYEWRAVTFENERKHCYERGYALHVLESRVDVEPILPYHSGASGLRWRIHQFFMPFYVRACRNADGDVRYAGRFYRRVLLHDLHRGYLDARRGRPRRP